VSLVHVDLRPQWPHGPDVRGSPASGSFTERKPIFSASKPSFTAGKPIMKNSELTARSSEPIAKNGDPPESTRKEKNSLGGTSMIDLTDQQRQAVRNGEAVRLLAPEIGEDVVLLSATQFRKMCELLEDRREQDAILRYSIKQAATVAQENPY
jgi:hypothetical protein